MIVVAAILMLATMLGGLALRRNMRARSNEAAPPAESLERRSQPGRND
jgi:hypothetical protein